MQNDCFPPSGHNCLALLNDFRSKPKLHQEFKGLIELWPPTIGLVDELANLVQDQDEMRNAIGFALQKVRGLANCLLHVYTHQRVLNFGHGIVDALSVGKTKPIMSDVEINLRLFPRGGVDASCLC